MTRAVSPIAIAQDYLERDASPRAGMFGEFLNSVKAIVKTDTAMARTLAKRAVSVDLDFTSLMSLRRFVCSREAVSGTTSLRLAILGGPTTHQLKTLIDVFLSAQGVAAEIYEGGYGLFRHEILSDYSDLDRFKPQIVFLATGSRDAAVAVPVSAPREEVQSSLDAELESWMQLWNNIHTRWGASVIQNLFDIPPWSVMGHAAVRCPAARETCLERLNQLFCDSAPSHVTLHDLRPLVVDAGARAWFDPRFYLEAKMPCGPETLVPYAHSVSQLMLAMTGKSKKVLVLDLDNTLWGGVIGDVGVEGVIYGQGSATGEAFLAFHSYVKGLRDRGILLAVCSKNDERVARAPFEVRDDMVLKMEHFSCFVANWQDKASNLELIADRLNLGLDSFVFIDDDPAQRALVRRLQPAVTVPDLPADPADYVAALARQRCFETSSWTSEDLNRARYYAQDSERQHLAVEASDLETFLASLEMTARLQPVQPSNLERVTQLVNKSNQFNLTTKRRTSGEVQALALDPRWRTLTIGLADKLGDNGLISVIFLECQDAALVIDTWVMSCRVLSRGVEVLALNQLVEMARKMGYVSLLGTYIPTERNGLVRDHYASLGFEAAGTDGVTTRWTLSADAYHPRPVHIQVEVAV